MSEKLLIVPKGAIDIEALKRNGPLVEECSDEEIRLQTVNDDTTYDVIKRLRKEGELLEKAVRAEMDKNTIIVLPKRF